MDCPNCHQPLKEGAKFCTHCGTRVVPQEEPQPQAQEPAAPQETAAEQEPEKENDKQQEVTESQDLSMSDTGRVFWNIQPGQVARVITQEEIGKLKRVRGVIIAEGTTAYIRVNGTTIATVEGGSYDFKQVKDQPVNQKEENSVQRAWGFVTNLFRAKDKPAAEGEKALKEQQEKGSIFSVVVLVDKAFPLVVGKKQANLDDYANFEPMTIQTKYHTLQMGLNAYFKIADKEVFMKHYLADKNVLNTTQILDEISDSVRAVLQEQLQDAEWEGTHLPDDLRRDMKNHINAVAKEYFFGLEVVRIVEITSSNEDLERFQQLGREMYLSEQELDYLRRTNDFKNRLAEVNNAQQITEAQTAVDLQRELDRINQDNLLRQDELDKFRLLYDSERRLREARTKEDEEAALADIRRSQLLREDDIAAIQHQVDTNTYQRGQMLQMMQLKDSIEYKRVQLEGDLQRAEMTAMSELNIQRAKYDLEFEQQKREEELRAQRRQQQFEQFMAMEAAANQHELEKERQRAENMRGMSWEQMTAFQGGEAATELARGYSDAKREREFAERMQEQQNQQNGQMFELLNRMMDGREKDQQRAEEQMRQKDEQAATAYDRALNYTTRQQGAPVPTQRFCPECGAKINATETVCPNCNSRV